MVPTLRRPTLLLKHLVGAIGCVEVSGSLSHKAVQLPPHGRERINEAAVVNQGVRQAEA
jgi:hypothetical protein